MTPEIDEGNVSEAIADPITHGYGNVMSVVDLNHQNLDRVVPGARARRLGHMYDTAPQRQQTATTGEQP